MKKRVNFCLIALFAIIIILTLIVNLIVVSAPETGSPATSGSLNYWVTCGCPNADRDGFCPVKPVEEPAAETDLTKCKPHKEYGEICLSDSDCSACQKCSSEGYCKSLEFVGLIGPACKINSKDGVCCNYDPDDKQKISCFQKSVCENCNIKIQEKCECLECGDLNSKINLGCPQGFNCKENKCIPQCKTDRDCKSGTCKQGICVTECGQKIGFMSRKQCEDGKICDKGKCIEKCKETSNTKNPNAVPPEISAQLSRELLQFGRITSCSGNQCPIPKTCEGLACNKCNFCPYPDQKMNKLGECECEKENQIILNFFEGYKDNLNFETGLFFKINKKGPCVCKSIKEKMDESYNCICKDDKACKNKNDVCVCPDGFLMSDKGYCICPANKVEVDGKCICSNGQETEDCEPISIEKACIHEISIDYSLKEQTLESALKCPTDEKKRSEGKCIPGDCYYESSCELLNSKDGIEKRKEREKPLECGVWSDGCGGTIKCGTCKDKIFCRKDSDGIDRIYKIPDYCSSEGKCYSSASAETTSTETNSEQELSKLTSLPKEILIEDCGPCGTCSKNYCEEEGSSESESDLNSDSYPTCELKDEFSECSGIKEKTRNICPTSPSRWICLKSSNFDKISTPKNLNGLDLRDTEYFYGESSDLNGNKMFCAKEYIPIMKTECIKEINKEAIESLKKADKIFQDYLKEQLIESKDSIYNEIRKQFNENPEVDEEEIISLYLEYINAQIPLMDGSPQSRSLLVFDSSFSFNNPPTKQKTIPDYLNKIKSKYKNEESKPGGKYVISSKLLAEYYLKLLDLYKKEIERIVSKDLYNYGGFNRLDDLKRDIKSSEEACSELLRIVDKYPNIGLEKSDIYDKFADIQSFKGQIYTLELNKITEPYSYGIQNSLYYEKQAYDSADFNKKEKYKTKIVMIKKSILNMMVYEINRNVKMGKQFIEHHFPQDYQEFASLGGINSNELTYYVRLLDYWMRKGYYARESYKYLFGTFNKEDTEEIIIAKTEVMAKYAKGFEVLRDIIQTGNEDEVYCIKNKQNIAEKIRMINSAKKMGLSESQITSCSAKYNKQYFEDLISIDECYLILKDVCSADFACIFSDVNLLINYGDASKLGRDTEFEKIMGSNPLQECKVKKQIKPKGFKFIVPHGEYENIINYPYYPGGLNPKLEEQIKYQLDNSNVMMFTLKLETAILLSSAGSSMVAGFEAGLWTGLFNSAKTLAILGASSQVMGYAEESLIASDPYSGDISANLMNQFMLIADGIALKSPKTKDSFNKAIESLKSSIKKPVVKCIYETTVSGKNSRETCPSSGYSKVPMKPLSEVMSKNFDSQRISYAEEVLSNGGENGFKLSSEQKDAIWAAHKAKGLRAKIKKLRAEFDECQYNELIRRGICGEEDVKLNELFSNLKEQLKDDGLNEDAEAFLRDELNDLLLSTRSGKREDGQIIPSDGSELLGSGKKFSFRININSKGGNIESFKIELLRPEQSPITVKQITDEFDLEAIKNLRDGLDMGKIKPDPIEENKFSADLKDKKGNVRRLIFEKDASGKHKIIGEIKEKVTGISGNINCQKTSVSTRPRSPVNPTRWNLAKEWLDNPSPPDMTKTRDLEGMAVEMGYIVREFGDTEGKRIINPLNNDHIGTIVRSRTTSNGVAEHTIRALSVGRWLNRGERP